MASVQMNDNIHKNAKEKALREGLDLKQVANSLFTQWLEGKIKFKLEYERI